MSAQDNNDDINMVDDGGIGEQEEQDVIFVRYIPGKTTKNLATTALLKSPNNTPPLRVSSPIGQADIEEKYKVQEFYDTQYDTSGSSTDSSNQSLASLDIHKRHRVGKKKRQTPRCTLAQCCLSSLSSDEECGDVNTGLERNGLLSKSCREDMRMPGHGKKKWLTAVTDCQPFGTSSDTSKTVKHEDSQLRDETENVVEKSATNSSRGMNVDMLPSRRKTTREDTKLSENTSKLSCTSGTSRPPTDCQQTYTSNDSATSTMPPTEDHACTAGENISQIISDTTTVEQECSCSEIPGRQLCPPCVVELGKCKTGPLRKQPVTTSKSTEDIRSVGPTWSQFAVKIESTSGKDNGLSLQNSAERSKVISAYVKRKPVIVSNLTEGTPPNEATWLPGTVKQEPTGDTSQRHDELTRLKKRHVGKCLPIVINKRKKCNLGGVSGPFDRVKKERSHDTVSNIPKNNCSVASTWSTIAVKQKYTCGEDSGLGLQNSAFPSTVSAMSWEKKKKKNKKKEKKEKRKEKNHRATGDARSSFRVKTDRSHNTTTVHHQADVVDSCDSQTKYVSMHHTSDKTGNAVSMYPTTCVNDGVCRMKRPLEYAVDSTTDSSVAPKKQQLAPPMSQPLPSTSRLSSLDTANDHEICSGCGTLKPIQDLLLCPNEHRCCSQCLQQQAKSLLTEQSKGSLKCIVPACQCFYTLGELRKGLPEILVEIVEEKLEKESRECATKTTSRDETNNSKISKRPRLDKAKVYPLMLPTTWEPMHINGEMKTVDILTETDEYLNLLIQFHSTQPKPKACITRIRRVQNPILWKFYSVKRNHMLQENGNDKLHEYYLFHGTSKDVVDAICKNNFDCRLCGRHGTSYGQGSYFARDALYAHKYTDGGNPRRTIRYLGRQVHLWGQIPVGQIQASLQLRQGSQQPTQTSQQLTQAQMQNRVSRWRVLINQQRAAQLAALLTQTSQQPTQASHQPTQASRRPIDASQQPVQVSQWATQAGPQPKQASQLQAQLTQAIQQRWATQKALVWKREQPMAIQTQLTAIQQQAMNSQPQVQISQQPQSNQTSNEDSITAKHVMFVAQVLVGNSALGSKQLRKPPPLDASNPFGKCFDSCVDDPKHPHMYVIFDNAQCYPAYIIEYTLQT